MDRLYKIRRSSRDMASAAYSPGDCTICRKTNVKVRRLKCGIHNFCKLCYEFEPKLARGDFSCTLCTDKMRARTFDSRYNVDNFFSKHTGMKGTMNGSTVNVDGDKIIDFGKNTDEENDLDGFNTKWDHLLQSSTSSSRPESTSKGKTSPTFDTEPMIKKIPKKPSYIHLVLPTTKTNYTEFESNEAAPQPIANTVTQLLDSGIPGPSRSKSGSLNCASLRSKFGSGIITKPRRSLANFETDPSEIERGTSPCKGIRLQRSYVWSDDTFSIDPSYSETEQMMEQIGTIEGPTFSSSCSSSASSSVGSKSSGINLADEGFWD